MGMKQNREALEKSLDPAVQQMIARADAKNVTTVWDRSAAMTPQCSFGDTGLCCRHCLQGPCRIDPFGEGPQEGICGAGPGTAAHSGHAKHLAHTMKKMA
jgi:carbon-monoxide dehydrogenase catalytic subunit